ncbi:MAG: GDP-mannose 4,6-dehydratase [Chloroflexi bacterium]|nr:GDP-mannose 4,6-dehydratase [Chloroflexota bacterium]MCC6891500.1 GDP-mannose 4,6-dehydratase [Anaerolineae bacterium]
MTTLITGGAGFVGSRLAHRLINAGESIVILDNFNDFYDPAIKRANAAAISKNAPVIEGDIRDAELVTKIFKEHNITRVAHLAGLANVRKSIEFGDLYADVNTTGAVKLMNIARQFPVSVFVQISTSSVYGQTTHIPFSEEDNPDRPLSPYPASKRAAELFAYTYYELHKLNVTVLRLFNVYGPNGRPDMMPLRTIEAILQEKPITVYDEGKLERDWTYVDDTVAGIAAALERPLGYSIINLGYGSPISLNEFIRIYEELIGKKAIIEYAPAPASEPRITYCNNSRARELLGFNPQVKINEGLARTWAWYQEHKLPTLNAR